MTTPPAELRLEDVRAGRISPVVAGFSAKSAALGGIDTEWITPDGGGSELHVLYFHGGGYINGFPQDYHGATVGLAHALDATVVVPDYRLAPENPFPASHDDACRAVDALLENDSVDASRLVIAGDSAGCALSIWALLRITGSSSRPALGAILNSPYVDMTASSPSLHDPRHQSERLPLARIQWLIRTYLGDSDPTDPRHSPVFADLTGLPPLLIQIGGHDPLHDDGVRLADRAREHGVEVRLTDYTESGHIWVARGTNPLDPEATRALDEAAEFVADLKRRRQPGQQTIIHNDHELRISS